MYLKFYLENQRMPIEDEVNDICKRLFTAVQSFAPKTEYEKFYKIVEKREKSYEERILRDLQNGITLETLMAKKHKENAGRKISFCETKEAAEESKTEKRNKR